MKTVNRGSYDDSHSLTWENTVSRLKFRSVAELWRQSRVRPHSSSDYQMNIHFQPPQRDARRAKSEQVEFARQAVKKRREIWIKRESSKQGFLGNSANFIKPHKFEGFLLWVRSNHFGLDFAVDAGNRISPAPTLLWIRFGRRRRWKRMILFSCIQE